MSYYWKRLGRVYFSTLIAQCARSGAVPYWLAPVSAIVFALGLVLWTRADELLARPLHLHRWPPGRTFVRLILVLLPFGGGTLAMMLPTFIERPSYIVCMATATAVNIFYPLDGCSPEWFIGAYVLYVLVHPPVSMLLRLIDETAGAGGLALLLVPVLALCISLIYGIPMDEGVYNAAGGIRNHSFQYPPAVFADYCTFLMGAILAVLCQRLSERFPALSSHPASHPLEARPVVSTIGDGAFIALLVIIVVEAQRCTAMSFPETSSCEVGFNNLQHNLHWEHVVTPLTMLYVLCSASTRGGGWLARMFRSPLFTFLGMIMLETYLLMFVITGALEQLQIAGISSCSPAVAVVVLFVCLIGTSYILSQLVVQPFVSEAGN